ncbi:putative permease [Belliella baltica DSM 15883]|uniref:Putative permease n=1 Tax=Belliella baltica (strain DSM 15883 / CIP 108006 / LMG 21964 / BA134) TaxID=866536 RepID=I3Z3K1_BELBD|nr:AEC family transporter [Belliella baltica]AFL83819.1 putative permease [Belliella baltica DSM 15883]
MTNLIIVVIFLVVGIGLQFVRQVPFSTAQYLNKYLIYVVLPILALKYIPEIELELSLLWPISIAWISFGLSWLLFGTLGKQLNWKKSLTGCLIITAGLANTSFVGFPIVRALYGEEALKIALLIDQAGSFILVSSVAIVVASIYSDEKKRKRDITRKILTFPPFIFFIIAFMLNFSGFQFSAGISAVFDLVTKTLTPVALIAVGLQIKVNGNAIRSKYLWLGLGYKLVLIPAVIFVLFGFIFRLDDFVFKVSVIETAMAPMITGSIIAISHNLEPKLASLLVGLGIPLSFVTIGIWYFILG